MKTFVLVFLILGALMMSLPGYSQQDSTQLTTPQKYSRIIKNDGSEYIGIIIRQDAREVLVKTENLGEIIIPKHEIKLIEEITDSEVKDDGEIWPRNRLTSRYTLTTNGFPVKKGEGYLRVMPAGIDCQFPITDNWSIGGMTSWYGIPLIVTTKVSAALDDELHVSAGMLYGNLLHGAAFAGESTFSYGGGIGFANLTFGGEENNLNLSAGYGFVHYPTSEFTPTGSITTTGVYGTTMFSIGGMSRVTKRGTFVFDSMGLISDGSIYYWLNPAIRYMPQPDNIWQFGLSLAGADDFLIPIPIPSVSFTKVFEKK